MEKLIALEKYPIVSISDAWQQRDNAKQLLGKGVDPSVNRKAERAARNDTAANSFEKIARKWYGHKQGEWSPEYATAILTRMDKDIFPWIGSTPLTEVTAKDIKGNNRGGKAFADNYRAGVHIRHFHGSSQF